MKLTYVVEILKSKFLIKNGINSINIGYSGSCKRTVIYFGERVKILKVHFNKFEMNYIK